MIYGNTGYRRKILPSALPTPPTATPIPRKNKMFKVAWGIENIQQNQEFIHMQLPPNSSIVPPPPPADLSFLGFTVPQKYNPFLEKKKLGR